MSSEIEQNQVVRDRLGQIISVGDIIVYGHALGRCAGLQLGKVLAINKKTGCRFYDPPGESHSFTVWGIDEDWGGKYKPALNNRKGTLLFPDRMVVLPKEKVPAEIVELLKDVTIDSTPKSLGIAGRTYYERRVLRDQKEE